MADYGIKISKPGKDVKSASPNELVFSSKYSTLRVQSQGSGTVTRTNRTATIAHNLGYVPYFLVHTTPDPLYDSGFYDSNDYFINPVVPVITGACHIDREVVAYADDTNLYIEIGDDVGYDYSYPTSNDDDSYAKETETGPYAGYSTGWTEVGYYAGSDSSPINGAFRFVDVDVSQGSTIKEAVLGFYISDRNGAYDVKTTIYGIDEDNTAQFDTGTAAIARPKTTASGDETCSSSISSGDWWAIGVTNQVQEIINRGGWSSGNALGLILDDNGTDTSDFNWITDYGDESVYCPKTYLRIATLDDLIDYKYTIFYNKIE